ncbi:hypothetical protein RHMOL_Rhmol11G0003100 [Rhododendron molle]|uniref:Uncharacterized protein n=1 Tax=Rhododendron molle TaxID=49168 RepID=A0ACC0LMF9_RHOML|nr:hypothetical protein RHMOL_Rhmol11G0003100 [Rhododendron molle]
MLERAKERNIIKGCKVEKLPIKYLGLPLGANPSRIKTWDPVIERTEKVLSVWRSQCIRQGEGLPLSVPTL